MPEKHFHNFALDGGNGDINTYMVLKPSKITKFINILLFIASKYKVRCKC